MTKPLMLPELGFGTSAIAGLYAPVSHDAAMDVLSYAWSEGLRYFDTAPHYGNGLSERRLGDFLRHQPSDTYTLSTKVGRILQADLASPSRINGFSGALPFRQVYDYSYDGIMRSVEDSFQRLGLPRIDVLYVHDIGEFTHGAANETYLEQLLSSGFRALQELKSDGTITAFGLGVNEVEICGRILAETDLDVIMLAGRYTLLDQSAAEALLPLCAARKVQMVAAGVFNSGILATGPSVGATFDYEPASDAILGQARDLQRICDRLGVPLAAAALQFPRQAGRFQTTVMGSAKAASIARNLEQWAMPLPDTLWQALAEANTPKVSG